MSPLSIKRAVTGRGSIRHAALAVVVTLVGGCSWLGIDLPAADGSAYPSTVTNRYARALGYMDAGDDTRAQRELETFGETYPDFAGAQVNLGIIYGRNGRPDAAEAAFERAVMVCAQCAPAYNHLGISQRRSGRFDAAEQSYLRALEADPDYALAYYNLGILYDLYLGRPELALRYYEDYVAHESVDTDVEQVRRWIIDLQRRVGAPDRAAQLGSMP